MTSRYLTIQKLYYDENFDYLIHFNDDFDIDDEEVVLNYDESELIYNLMCINKVYKENDDDTYKYAVDTILLRFNEEFNICKYIKYLLKLNISLYVNDKDNIKSIESEPLNKTLCRKNSIQFELPADDFLISVISSINANIIKFESINDSLFNKNTILFIKEITNYSYKTLIGEELLKLEFEYELLNGYKSLINYDFELIIGDYSIIHLLKDENEKLKKEIKKLKQKK